MTTLSLSHRRLRELLAEIRSLRDENDDLRRQLNGQNYCGFCGAPIHAGAITCAAHADLAGRRVA